MCSVKLDARWLLVNVLRVLDSVLGTVIILVVFDELSNKFYFQPDEFIHRNVKYACLGFYSW